MDLHKRNCRRRPCHPLAGKFISLLNHQRARESSFLQTRENIQPLLIKAGNELQSKFGCYRHSDLIGLPYGSKVGSRNGKGFVHVLRPTPELWTMALPHRTQILYLADISFITSYLNIRSGSRVIEAGMVLHLYFHGYAIWCPDLSRAAESLNLMWPAA